MSWEQWEEVRNCLNIRMCFFVKCSVLLFSSAPGILETGMISSTLNVDDEVLLMHFLDLHEAQTTVTSPQRLRPTHLTPRPRRGTHALHNTVSFIK